MVPRTLEVVYIHRVIAPTPGAPHLTHRERAPPSEVVHRVTFGTLRNDCFVPAVNELDLMTEHAHSLKCGTLRDRLVLFDICERDRRHVCFSVLWFPYPARPNSKEDRLETRIGDERVVKVVAGVYNAIFIVDGNLSELRPGPPLRWNNRAFSWERFA